MTQHASDTPPSSQPTMRPKKSRLRRQLSPIWLLPIAALLISLSVAWVNYVNRGVLIEIAFENASGITKGTAVKYRDVTVGRVEKVTFTPGLDAILIQARIDKDIAPFLDQDAAFWVVRPDVSLRGISGLDTVLSGVYLEGTWDRNPDLTQVSFQGLDRAPIRRAGQRGIAITLRTENASSLAQGAPILHKGIRVGYLEAPELASNGRDVRVTAFIETPYNRRINSQTRFWDTSGFSVSVGGSGLSLDVDSVASLIEGGIAFETFVSGGVPVRDGHTFTIHDTKDNAREDLFRTPDDQLLDALVIFDENVSGLNLDASVKFRGVQIGTVANIEAVVHNDDNHPSLKLHTSIKIDPNSLGMPHEPTPQAALALLQDLIETQSLRARMINDGLLSNQLALELTFMEGEANSSLNYSDTGLPIIPATRSELTNIAKSAEGLLSRVNNLPVEELLNSAIRTLNSIENITNSEELQKAPKELTALLTNITSLIESDDIQSIPENLSAILDEVKTTASNMAGVSAQALKSDVFIQMSQAVQNFEDGTTALPDLIADLRTLTQKTSNLELEALIAQVGDSFASLEQLTSDDALTSLPSATQATLDEIRKIVIHINDSNIVPNTNAAITSANTAATAIAQASTQLPILTQRATALMDDAQAGIRRLPNIMKNIEGVTQQANEAELDLLITQTNKTLQSVKTFLSLPDTIALPTAIGGSLDEVRTTLQELRQGGAVTALNDALNSIDRAASSVETASNDLPKLSKRLQSLALEVSGAVKEYGHRGSVNKNLLDTLDSIDEAAKSMEAFANLLRRNPNALITGR